MIGKHRNFTFLILIVALSASFVGCSTASSQQKDPKNQDALTELQARLEESERLNKQLDRKIGRLEQVLAAAQDRIEAQAVATQYEQHQPDPIPESRFAGGLDDAGPVRQEGSSLVNKRQPKIISLSSNHYTPPGVPRGYYYDEGGPLPDDTNAETIVITQEDYDAFAGESSEKPEKQEGGRNVRGRRVAQPDVTNDRLPVAAKDDDNLSAPRPAPVAPSSKRDLALYEEGLALYRNGDFQSSLARFQQFLTQGPEPSYLDNALYWIGESYYGLNNMPKSIKYFQRVITETPAGNKVPNAMLKMAIAYRNIGQEKKSKSLLSSVMRKFPTTGAGQIAKRELDK